MKWLLSFIFVGFFWVAACLLQDHFLEIESTSYLMFYGFACGTFCVCVVSIIFERDLSNQSSAGE